MREMELSETRCFASHGTPAHYDAVSNQWQLLQDMVIIAL